MSILKPLKAAIFQAASRLGYTIKRNDAPPDPGYLVSDPNYAAVIKAVRPYTMTDSERIAAMVDATRYISRIKLPGAIVECGVWRGGSMMVAALTLMEAGDIRDLYLLDTYAGMTEPTALDVDEHGVTADKRYADGIASDHNDWCYASIEDVKRNLLSTGYPADRLHFIKGDVLKTIPVEALGEIAILRLDTDWYESTLHELKHLYPKLNSRGVLIVDDYGYWQGCQKAVDEYFGPDGPFLARIDATGRIVIKH